MISEFEETSEALYYLPRCVPEKLVLEFFREKKTRTDRSDQSINFKKKLEASWVVSFRISIQQTNHRQKKSSIHANSKYYLSLS